MAAYDLVCPALLMALVAVFIIIIYLSVRKVPCGELPPMDLRYLYYNIEMQSRMKGWHAVVEPYGNKVTITKGSLVGTEMFFAQRPDGRISVYYTASSGVLGWVMVIVLLGTVFGSLVVGIWLHIASGKFTKEEVMPMITSGAGPIQVVQYN